ncbi:MAG: PepSY domain-containing protein [Nitrososphaeraceae archaeon]
MKTSRKSLVTYILAAGLLTSVIIVVLPMATAQFPMKDHPMANITGSVNVREAINNFINQNQKVSFSQASETAQNQITNGTVLGGHIGIAQGYLVYTFFVADNGIKTGYRVTVDPGNGQVLHTSEGFPLKSLGLMQGGGLGGNWKDHIRGGMWHPHDGVWKMTNQTVK